MGASSWHTKDEGRGRSNGAWREGLGEEQDMGTGVREDLYEEEEDEESRLRMKDEFLEETIGK